MKNLLGMVNRKYERIIYLMSDNVLESMLKDAIGLYEEFVTVHDHTKAKAVTLALNEVFEGYHTQIMDLDTELDPRAQCQNCEAIWPESNLLDIEDLHERVSPGEPMPSGECPLCRSLCQRLEE